MSDSTGPFGGRVYRCSKCGEKGHSSRTCGMTKEQRKEREREGKARANERRVRDRVDRVIEHDIGHGVIIAALTDRTGIRWKHPGCRCWYTLRFKPDVRSTGHALEAGSLDNIGELTIGGSLLCPRTPLCKVHGHIRAGRWEPC